MSEDTAGPKPGRLTAKDRKQLDRARDWERVRVNPYGKTRQPTFVQGGEDAFLHPAVRDSEQQ